MVLVGIKDGVLVTFLLLWQNISQKRRKEGKPSSITVLKGSVHHSLEGRMDLSYSHHVMPPSRRKGNGSVGKVFLVALHFICAHSLWDGGTHTLAGLPTSTNPFWKCPQTHPEVSLTSLLSESDQCNRQWRLTTSSGEILLEGCLFLSNQSEHPSTL